MDNSINVYKYCLYSIPFNTNKSLIKLSNHIGFVVDETKQQGRKRRRQFFRAKQPLSLHGRLVWHRVDGVVLLVDHPFAARTDGLDPFGEYWGGDGGFHFCHAVVDGGLEQSERF